MPPPKPKPKGTGLRLVKGVPVESVLKWQPSAELAAHCNSLLGLTPDGKFRQPNEKYTRPEGMDAPDPYRPPE